MLSVADIVKPMEWAKSFFGDGLPDGPYDDYYTGVKFNYDWYMGNIDTILEAYREHGPVFTARVMGLKPVWVIGAEANQRMYVNEWRDFYWWGGALQGHLAGLIGNGLLASVDETHDKARKLLDPVFSKTNLKKYVSDMVEITEVEVSALEEGQSFDFYEWVYDLALLNATDCFMGMDTDTVDAHALHDNFDTCVEYFQYPIQLQVLRGPGTPHWTFQQAKSKIDDVLYDEIAERRQNGPTDDDNILDRLLDAEEDGETFTDEEIHDQIMTLYWAGHDTTISAISWLVMLLGKYPDVYDNVMTELEERVGDEPIDAEEVTDGLPYLEMVMDEALRLYPPAWIAARKTRQEFEIYGETIPPETEVVFSSYATHRLPHLFEQPEAFKPRRMEPEKQREFPSGAYIPFARGPRTCIGMNFAKYEMKLVIATLLRHFDFELVPGQQFRKLPVATLTPESVEITLNRRENGTRVNEPTANSRIDVDTTTTQSQSVDTNGNTGESDCPIH